LTETHEAIEELLAGYVLRSLSGEDAERADHLLSDHVPHCPACRDSLAVFQGVTADLALDAPPIQPPDTLLPRLHRELGDQDRRRRPVAVFAVAASVVAVVGFAGLAVTQNMRVNDTRSRMDDIRSAMDFATRPGASMVQVDSSDSGTEPITEISHPGTERFYLVGNDVPMPPEGTVYRVWLLSGTQATFATDFVPEPGMMVVELEFDPSLYDRILISVEPAGSTPDTPEIAVWQTAS
jgi:anti-sigma-K factor RskA